MDVSKTRLPNSMSNLRYLTLAFPASLLRSLDYEWYYVTMMGNVNVDCLKEKSEPIIQHKCISGVLFYNKY